MLRIGEKMNGEYDDVPGEVDMAAETEDTQSEGYNWRNIFDDTYSALTPDLGYALNAGMWGASVPADPAGMVVDGSLIELIEDENVSMVDKSPDDKYTLSGKHHYNAYGSFASYITENGGEDLKKDIGRFAVVIGCATAAGLGYFEAAETVAEYSENLNQAGVLASVIGFNTGWGALNAYFRDKNPLSDDDLDGGPEEDLDEGPDEDLDGGLLEGDLNAEAAEEIGGDKEGLLIGGETDGLLEENYPTPEDHPYHP